MYGKKKTHHLIKQFALCMTIMLLLVPLSSLFPWAPIMNSSKGEEVIQDILDPVNSIEGADSGDNFGQNVSWIGDVNGDGYSDIAIGAPLYSYGHAIHEGRVYVYHGSPSGLPATADWIAEGNKVSVRVTGWGTH